MRIAKFLNLKGKIEKSLLFFIKELKREGFETKEAGIIIAKYLKTKKISKDEEILLKGQLKDIFKIFGIVIPFVLIPGASIIIPFLVKISKKYNIELLPINNKIVQEKEKQ